MSVVRAENRVRKESLDTSLSLRERHRLNQPKVRVSHELCIASLSEVFALLLFGWLSLYFRKKLSNKESEPFQKQQTIFN